MIKVAVTNQKGGVGKSGVSVCLAGVLAELGYRVLIVDLEPQATATEWLGARLPGEVSVLPDDIYGPRLLSSFLEGTAPPVCGTLSGVDLVPSGNELGRFELEAAAIPPGKREKLVRVSLEALERRWDVVFIDCPPSLGLLTVNALAAADWVLIPVKLDSASRTPLVRLFTAAQEVQQSINSELDLLGVVGTFYRKAANHSSDMLDWLREQFDQEAQELVFRTVIRENTHIGESHGHQMPVTQYVRRQDLRGTIGERDFRALADEFLERSGIARRSNEVRANG